MHLRDPETLLREVSWLRRLARSLTADASTADDAAGDTLLSWSAATTPVQQLRPWLATVLRHGSARRQRRAQLRQQGERAAARPEALPSVDEAIARTELHRAVVDAVLALREPYRSAIVLRFLDELPLATIARRLQVPAETARTRIKRGLELLRERLDHRYGGRSAWAGLLLPANAAPSLLTLLMATKSLLVAGAVAAAVFLFTMLPDANVPSPSPQAGSGPAGRDPVAALQVPETAADRQVVDAAPERAAPAMAVTGRVRGRAVDEATLQPLAGVTASWLPLDAGIAPCAETMTTGSDGCFTLTTVVAKPTDHLALLLRHRERAMITGQLASPDEAVTPPLFDVGDVLMPPGTEVTGAVRDSAGAAAADVPLFVCLFSYWSEGGRLVQLQQSLPIGRSDAEGHFRLDQRLLPNGTPPVLIAAGKAGVGFTDLAELRREQSSVRVDVQLLPPVELRVRVVEEDGTGVPGALVTAEPRTLPLGMPGTYPVPVETVAVLADCFCARTGADGRALLQPLAVRAGGSAPYTLRVAAEGRDTNVVPVQLPLAEEVQVVLPRSRQLQVQGSVRDAAGRPIPGVRVAAHWRQRVEVPAGSDGNYDLTLVRGDGPLSLVVTGSGWFAQRRELQPDAAAAAITADFTLKPAALLTGRVLDQSGNAVASADVWLAGGGAQSTPTGRDGTFTMEVAPSAASLLHVQPPQPSSAWAGSVDHLLAPGQTDVTLVLERLPAGRADLDVTLTDAQGKPLEARQVILQRTAEVDGLWHPHTATIGHVTASGLAPGDWSLGIEPTTGCRLAAQFAVQRDGELVQLQLVQPLAASARGEVVPGEGALPDDVELGFAEGSQQARFTAGTRQELLGKGHGLRLHPCDGLTFAIADVDPSRPLAVIARAGESGGEAQIRVGPGGEGALRIRLASMATLQLRSPTRFDGDRLVLQLRRPDGAWGEPLRCEGLAGRTQLLAWSVLPGVWEWRLRLPTRGADNRGSAAWQQGRCEVAPGAEAAIEVRER